MSAVASPILAEVLRSRSARPILTSSAHRLKRIWLSRYTRDAAADPRTLRPKTASHGCRWSLGFAGQDLRAFSILVRLEDLPLALTGSRAARQPSIDAVPIGTFADSEARSINARLGSLKAPRCRREAAKLLRSLAQEAAGEDRCLDQLKECNQLCDAVGNLALRQSIQRRTSRPTPACRIVPTQCGGRGSAVNKQCQVAAHRRCISSIRRSGGCRLSGVGSPLPSQRSMKVK